MKKLVILVGIVFFATWPFMGCSEEEQSETAVNVEVEEPADTNGDDVQEPADNGDVADTDDTENGDTYSEPVSDAEIRELRHDAINRIIYQIENSRYGTPDSWISFKEAKEQFPVLTDEVLKGVFVDAGDIFHDFEFYMGPMEDSPHIPRDNSDGRWIDHDSEEWILIRGKEKQY